MLHVLQGLHRGRRGKRIRKIGACPPRHRIHARLSITDVVRALQQKITSNVCYFCGIWLLLLFDITSHLVLGIPSWRHRLFYIGRVLVAPVEFAHVSRNFREMFGLLHGAFWGDFAGPVAKRLGFIWLVLLFYRNSIGLFWILIQILIWKFANFFF